MSVIVPFLANAKGPQRRHPLYVAPGEGPYYAALTDTADGVAVRLSRRDRPRGQRLISSILVDIAPFHVVADWMHNEVARLNREGEPG